ncbi:YtrH family sporulation protein [Pseudogracilibacillus auburnensis]|uniref:Sporulation protein YtrH n=1 Tax=Pseudogracilibacillus auburnensis TaxID=1494959 RepID=A0A2V3VWD3_9BACI|nr:YtrH family sporulation protein [Pseudogracilibacillus auburnensis]MBO1003391.1 YtrH family sporulation protein [Pseudogracilibacillus auburnensis]PXW85304.1 sporulation protein YtrH [Pseudogracilibacillus auburnensis]
MEERFFASFIHCFFIAFGVVIGGTVIGSIGSFLTGDAPLSAMNRIAQSIKIWAIVAAIGGTFDAIENFQRGFVDGSTMDLFKQSMFIIAAMIGVKTAILFITWVTNEEIM